MEEYMVLRRLCIGMRCTRKRSTEYPSGKAVVVLPLAERGEPILLNEEKMIKEKLFPRLHARLKRSRVVKNSEAASQRHAAGLAKEGIAPPDDDNAEDSKDTETKEDPANDLNLRNSQGKRVVESTPEHATRPTKMVTDSTPASKNVGGLPASTFVPQDPNIPASDLSVLKASTSTPIDPNISDPTPPTNPNVSAFTPANPDVQPANNPARSDLPGPLIPVSGPENVPQGPGATSTDAGKTSSFVSLSDFSALEILSHMI
ncbi:hypothetical protein QYF36_015472 [Acer negundo]|nr:hypothetical protein QYF36_015472 [Acer negundo]